MPTPPKPVSVLKSEGKSHRTKAELSRREKAEKSLLTGRKLREEADVRQLPIAHKEFARLKKLLGAMGKEDDLYGAQINRYCRLRQEEHDLAVHRDALRERIDGIAGRLAEARDEASFRDLSASLASLEKTFASLDTKIQAKRKMQAEIERENVMTISAALRSIPQKADEDDDPLRRILDG